MLRRVLIIDKSGEARGLVAYCAGERWPGLQIDLYEPARGCPAADYDWSRYDLVLMGYVLGLPDQDGLTWLRALHANPAAPPVIMLTAHGSEDVAVRALKLGAKDYLRKPELSPMRFVEAVESALGPEGAAPPAAERTVRLAPAEIPHRQPPTAAAPAPAPRAATGGAAAPKAGARVPGYELLRRLGEGGMADVHLARRAEDGLEVALKILQLEGQEDVTLLRRFMREYSLLARLTHPNVVHIYERAFARDFAYIAMEYFPAGDLAGRIQRGVGTDTAVSYLRQIAAGLGAAHALGIVHRDIKPGNILFRDEQRLAIVDFGISRATDQSSSMSMACALLGTPAYMSPEQVRGGEADVRSDLYSVGVVFYEMLTGRKPFQAAGLGDLLDAHLYAPPPRLHAELARLQPVLDGLLAKDPDERFQSTEELLLGVDWDE